MLIFFISLLFFLQLPLGHADNLKEYVTENEKKILETNKIITKSTVESADKKTQLLNFVIMGLHERPCEFALAKLSRYENFSEYISFIKTSSYEEKTKQLDYFLDDPLMPFAMRLRFKIPRIERPGEYSFVFDEGFLKDLKGTIYVSELEDKKKRCLFKTAANWTGPDTKIPNSIFSFFTEVLSEFAMKKLFLVSK